MRMVESSATFTIKVVVCVVGGEDCFFFFFALAIIVYLTKHLLVVVVPSHWIDVIPMQQLAPEDITVGLSEQCGFQKWRWKLNGIYVVKL